MKKQTIPIDHVICPIYVFPYVNLQNADGCYDGIHTWDGMIHTFPPQPFSSFCQASNFFGCPNWFSGKTEKSVRPEVDSLMKDSHCAATDNSWHCTLQLD